MLTLISFFFFFNDTATTEIYTLSLHDALPISPHALQPSERDHCDHEARTRHRSDRSEEHTSELQSLTNLVCRLLLEKKKNCASPSCPTRYPLFSASGRPPSPGASPASPGRRRE